MATIVVLSTEDGQSVGVTHSELTPEQGIMLCSAAIRYFQEQKIEAEVQQRVQAATQAKPETAEPEPDTMEETP